jgi:hypothetical protein
MMVLCYKWSFISDNVTWCVINDRHMTMLQINDYVINDRLTHDSRDSDTWLTHIQQIMSHGGILLLMIGRHMTHVTHS